MNTYPTKQEADVKTFCGVIKVPAQANTCLRNLRLNTVKYTYNEICIDQLRCVQNIVTISGENGEFVFE